MPKPQKSSIASRLLVFGGKEDRSALDLPLSKRMARTAKGDETK